MPKLSQEKLKSVFRVLENTTVFTINELVSLLRCSKPTARLRLKQWKTHTSYNQNGRYYAMPTVSHFDKNGLWHYENIFFSRYGNLKTTVVHLISNSPAGLNGRQIGDLVRLSPRSFLHHFRSVTGIRREKRDGIYIYFSDDPDRYKEQVRKRSRVLIGTDKGLSDPEAVVILSALIKRQGLFLEDIMQLPEVRRRGFSRVVIRQFLDRHGLLKKTPTLTH